jgi:hypothetical protein
VLVEQEIMEGGLLSSTEVDSYCKSLKVVQIEDFGGEEYALIFSLVPI